MKSTSSLMKPFITVRTQAVLSACYVLMQAATDVFNLRIQSIGIEELTKLVRKWIDAPSTYNPEEMRACLDSWREVLFSHLDQEVSGLILLAVFVRWETVLLPSPTSPRKCPMAQH